MRALLVLVLVCIATPAAAFRIRNKVPSECVRHGQLLPERGAVDVPTNTRSWVVDGASTTSTPVQGLQPHQLYEGPDAPAGFFTTGAGPDLEPPATPRIGMVAITVSHGAAFERGNVAHLRISGSFDADTAVIRLRFLDRRGTATYYTTSMWRSVCNPGFLLTTGPVLVEVVAIDLAGNESAPAVVVATAASEDEPPSEHDHAAPPRHHGLLLVFAGLGMLLPIAAAGWAIARTKRRDAAAYEAMPLAGADELARTVRLRSAIIVVGTMMVAATFGRGEMLFPGLLLVPSLVWLVLVSAVRWWVAGIALALLRRDGAHVSVRHDQLEVMAGDKRATLCAPVRLVRRAREHAIPRASVDLQ
jgi:hypothetical protein